MSFGLAIHFGRHFEIEDFHQNFFIFAGLHEYLAKLYTTIWKKLTWKESVQSINKIVIN